MDLTMRLKNQEEFVWLNPGHDHFEPLTKLSGYGYVYVKAAQNRFMRFLPYVAQAFPETAARKGVIEAPLLPVPEMKEFLNSRGARISGNVFIKDDAKLPISGSVEDRGGIHAVLKLAEMQAQAAEMLMPTENYSKVNSEEFRSFYHQYTIHIPSCDDLALSCGRMALRLGFCVVAHASAGSDDKMKKLLQEEGITVREHEENPEITAGEARKEAMADAGGLFIEDGAAGDLFFGYATASLRLKIQFKKAGIHVDPEHPLFLYLPCQSGRIAGGITFGFKHVFGDNVHCFFAEPVNSPCFTYGMVSGRKEEASVGELGLSKDTIALACDHPSRLACLLMERLVSGSVTVSEENLKLYTEAMREQEQMVLPPLSCAGFAVLDRIQRDETFAAYLKEHGLSDHMDQASHIVWVTGGR